jgi:riboflavin kinase / FMN adenylyltransferase
MKLSRYIEDIPFDKNSIVTIGTFDGVHLAHQKIIGKAVELAKKCNGRSVVVTFEPHPREVLDMTTDMKLLTTLQERQELCEKLGVDWFVVIEFNKTFSQQGFRDFYLKYLIGGIGISTIV